MRWKYRKMQQRLYDADIALIHATVWGNDEEIRAAQEQKRRAMLELLTVSDDDVLEQITSMSRATIERLYGEA